MQVICDFPDAETAEEFIEFMNGSGEQSYWEWCESGDHPFCQYVDYMDNVIKFTERVN